MERTKIESIARVCHEANKAYCESIDDLSQESWEISPKWQRESAINGVNYHLSGDRTPEQSHESWLKEKTEQGWVYGGIKDVVAKTHPCCIPYDQLPEPQKAKDRLFGAIVKALT